MKQSNTARTSDSAIRQIGVAAPQSATKRRRRRAKAAPAQSAVVEETIRAFRPDYRVATILGAIGGGSVPYATFSAAHQQVTWGWDGALLAQPIVWFVLAGTGFSISTVYLWGKQAFRNKLKAACFTAFVEGLMLASRDQVLAVHMLVLLIAINAIATGANLSRPQEAT